MSSFNQASIHNENLTFQITTPKMKEKLHRVVTISKDILEEQGKDEYVIGTAKPLAEDDLKYEVRDTENSMVMSWLLHSMQQSVKPICSHLLPKTFEKQCQKPTPR